MTAKVCYRLLLLMLLWLGISLNAHATDYTFPGLLPAGCSGSGSSYTCSTDVNLGWGDTMTFTNSAPITVTINGNFYTNNGLINAAGSAANLNFVVTGTTSFGFQTNFNASVTTGSLIDINGQVVVGGSITATSGAITLVFSTRVVGNVTSNTGAITIGSEGNIGGFVQSNSGDINLLFRTNVTGNVTTSGAITLANESTVGGNISGATGNVVMQYASRVTGTLTTTSGSIDIQGAVVANSCVKSTNSAPISLAWGASVSKVCCGSSCSNACVTNNTGSSMPPLCTSQTCIPDDFSSGTLDSSLWNPVNISGSFTPQVVDVSGQKRLRLTDTSGSQSTLVQLKKWFPGAGNKIVVQFDYYVYGGTGADGIGVVFSDASVTPAPGGNGGSLGYAQKVATNGFAGGWLGVGINEHGKYPSATEGRVGYPTGWTQPAGASVASGIYPNSVSVRGSGSGTSGYWLLANTGTLSPVLWSNASTSSSVQKFRITLDNTNNVNANVTVERDTTGTGSSYQTIVPTFDALGTNSQQAAVPANWLVSFTSSTGGSNNIHELANVSVCATYVLSPSGSNNASAFECIETGTNTPWSASARKPLYTKLAGVNFTFDIAALQTDGSLESNYVAAGANTKYVLAELFDDSASPAPVCSAYNSPVASQVVAFTSGNYSGAAGRFKSGNFNVAAPYSKLRCRIKECTDSSCSGFTSTAPACSSDQFSVRPSAVTLITSATAAAPSTTATPAFAAGANFTLRATTTPTTYVGTLTLDSSKLTAQTTTQASTQASGGAVGSLSTTSLTANAAATNTSYSEVGYLYLAAGAYRDDAFTAVDAAQGDCITDTTNGNNLSTTLVGGKYGCAVGNTTAVSLGRFYPDHFAITPTAVAPFCSATATPFTYFGQDGFDTTFTMTAQNAGNTTTQNYQGVFAKFGTTLYGNYGFAASTLPSGSALASGATAPSGSWSGGVASILARHQVSRPAAPAAETLLSVTAAPTDGEVAAGTPATVASGVRMRYGRLRMQNAYGSELLSLPIPLEAQYWNGSFYVTNTDDSCTTLPMSSVVMGNFTGNLQACETHITPTGTQTLSAGRIPGGLVLTRPGAGNSGSVDLSINVSSSASGSTCLSPSASAATAASRSWFGPNTGSRATFGIYKSPLIYRRENY